MENGRKALQLKKSQEKISTEENQFETIQNESKKETDGRFVRGFSGDKKAKEFEDIGSDSKKSWVDRILNSNQSRDDSVIKR